MTPTFPLSLYQSLAGGNVVLFQSIVGELTVDASAQMLLEPLLEANSVTGSTTDISEIAKHSSPNRLRFLADILRKSDRETAPLFKSKPDILKAARQAVRSGVRVIENQSPPELSRFQDSFLQTKMEELLSAAAKPATGGLLQTAIAMAKILPKQFHARDAEEMLRVLDELLLFEGVDEAASAQMMEMMGSLSSHLSDPVKAEWLRRWRKRVEDPASLLQQWKASFILARNHSEYTNPEEKKRNLRAIYHAMQIMGSFDLCSLLYYLSEDIVCFGEDELYNIVSRLATECLNNKFLGAPKAPTPLGWRAKENDPGFLPELRIGAKVRSSLRDLFNQFSEERQREIYESAVRILPIWWTTISRQTKTPALSHWLEWLSQD